MKLDKSLSNSARCLQSPGNNMVATGEGILTEWQGPSILTTKIFFFFFFLKFNLLECCSDSRFYSQRQLLSGCVVSRNQRENKSVGVSCFEACCKPGKRRFTRETFSAQYKWVDFLIVCLQTWSLRQLLYDGNKLAVSFGKFWSASATDGRKF
jgi:hypothetical protein